MTDNTTPPVISPADRDAVSPSVEFGMNINPDAHSLSVDKLSGLAWVRWVFWASRLGLTPEEAYESKYRPIIKAYADAGIRSLIILHQDTEWGNSPWANGNWEQYATKFAETCRRVATVCSEFGDGVAYQIFNEQDSGPDNHSAISIAAKDYALVLDQAQVAIRAAHPGARVIFGGLSTGPENGVRYTNEVKARLGGRLPIDALAIHPYGRYVRKILFNYGSIGKLSNSIDTFHNAFPLLPLWITEIGVASDTPIGPTYYQDIGIYMREVVDEVAGNFADRVPVLIWFGWTDMMRNAGILTASEQEKPAIFEAFTHMRDLRQNLPPPEKADDIPEPLSQSQLEFISFETSLKDYRDVPAGSTFTNTWRFRNSGTTTWGEGFSLAYAPEGTNSDPFTDETRFTLLSRASPMPVPPGAMTDITLTMTSPVIFGRSYRSRWQLQDPAGTPFGHLYAEITVTPAIAPNPGSRAAGMAFVRDQTVFDGTIFVAGTDFSKQWRVRNSGTRKWGNGFRLVFVQGDIQMARGITSHLVPDAQPGEEVILSIPMAAPQPLSSRGDAEFMTLWRMQDDRGGFFGDPVWAKITVTTGAPSPDDGVTPNQETALNRLLNDPTAWYSQLDRRWSNMKVGYGVQRFRTWGCLVTCMAMTLTSHNKRLTPLELNNRLIAAGDSGFMGSKIQFIAPTILLPGLRQSSNLRSFKEPALSQTVWTGENPITRIDGAIAAGHIVLAQVDTKPNNGLYDSDIEQHWVILVQRTTAGDDYLMIDPMIPADQVRQQPRSLMLKYSNRHPGQSNEKNLRETIKSSLIYSWQRDE